MCPKKFQEHFTVDLTQTFSLTNPPGICQPWIWTLLCCRTTNWLPLNSTTRTKNTRWRPYYPNLAYETATAMSMQCSIQWGHPRIGQRLHRWESWKITACHWIQNYQRVTNTGCSLRIYMCLQLCWRGQLTQGMVFASAGLQFLSIDVRWCRSFWLSCLSPTSWTTAQSYVLSCEALKSGWTDRLSCWLGFVIGFVVMTRLWSLRSTGFCHRFELGCDIPCCFTISYPDEALGTVRLKWWGRSIRLQIWQQQPLAENMRSELLSSDVHFIDVSLHEEIWKRKTNNWN